MTGNFHKLPTHFYENCVFTLDVGENTNTGTAIKYGWNVRSRHKLTNFFLSTSYKISEDS